MADELTINVGCCYRNDGTVKDVKVENLQTDVLGTLMTHTRQLIYGTGSPFTGTSLDLSGVGTGGYILIINRDPLNSVVYSTAEGEDAVVEIKGTECALFRTSTESTAPFLSVTSGGTAEVEYWLFDGTGTGSPPTSPGACLAKARMMTQAPLPANTRTLNTLTADANGVAAAVDGVTPADGDVVLVNDEVLGANNGVYSYDTIGSGGTPFALSRVGGLDTTEKVSSGVLVPVSEGAVGADTLWLLSTNDIITLNTTSLLWVKVGGSSGGDDILVNSVGINDANLNDTTPTAPGGDLNVLFQTSAGPPDDVSAYVDVSALEPLVSHDNLADFVANEHLDWTASVGTIHTDNYIEGGAGTDTTAIHDNVASEISAIALKGTPVSGDFLVIEDSADTNNKKRITIGTLPSSGGTVTGTGTADRVVRFTGASAIGDSDLVSTAGLLSFLSTATTPEIGQATGAGAGTSLTVSAQGAGTVSTDGGNLLLTSGPGGVTSGTSGGILIQPNTVGNDHGQTTIKSGDNALEVLSDNSGFRVLISSNTKVNCDSTGIGFLGATPVARPDVSGSRGGNAALADLLTELVNLGLITDSTT